MGRVVCTLRGHESRADFDPGLAVRLGCSTSFRHGSPGPHRLGGVFRQTLRPARDWAAANNFGVHWLQRDESLELTNPFARLVFVRDSRDAVVNGIHVWLSYPVVLQNGAGYASELDLNTVIRPVLSPPKNWKGSPVRRIVIDPGHGGKDPGNEDGPHQEKKFTLLLAQELCDQFETAQVSRLRSPARRTL